MILVLTIFSILFISVELPAVMREGGWKDFVFSSLILMTAVFYGLDYLLDWQLMPDPWGILKRLSPFADTFFSFFYTGT